MRTTGVGEPQAALREWPDDRRAVVVTGDPLRPVQDPVLRRDRDRGWSLEWSLSSSHRKVSFMPTPASRPSQELSEVRPWTAGVVTVLVALEALALLAVAVGLVVSLFSVHVLPLSGIVFATLVMAGGALWLGAAARGTWGGRRWPRAAVLVSQAFLLIVAMSLLRVTLGWWGILIAVVPVSTILCLFAPPTTAWMHRTRDDVAH